MSDNEDVLDRVNATLDRFALLIEENAQQLRKDRAEYDRQRAEDLAREKAKDEKRQAEDEKRQAEWERQRAEDLAREKAKDEERRAEDEKRRAEWERQRAEDLAREKAKDEKRQAEAEKRQAEWEQRQAEWERRDAELGNKIARVSEQVGGQANMIGEITEAMTVSDNIIDLVNKFEGIDVGYFSFNTTRKYPAIDSQGKEIRKQYEIDGFADGKKSVVVIEAKATLTKEYVMSFINKLAKFKLAYPDHANKDLYGAMTFIRANREALLLAQEHRLFIIKASPPEVELVNNKDFIPANFKTL